MDDDQMTDRERIDDELARRLEAYADARLSPTLAATSRMRAHVMAAAHQQAALARADEDRTRVLAAPTQLDRTRLDRTRMDRTRMDRTRQASWRRPMTALLAAGLTLAVGVGSVAAAQPGGPLYGARVWAETLTLPGNANERAQAELHRLQDRLAEAAAGAAAGDMGAAQAALDAYTAIVDEATHELGNDVAAAATLETGLRSNVDVLTVLVGRVPSEQAKAAIQRAIDRSDSAAEQIHGKPSDTPGGPPTANPNTTAKPQATDGPGRTANPNRPTTKPADATEKPRPTPKAASTPRAEHTPRGGPPSERPDGQPDNPGAN
jgi:hypothetical protein